MGLLDCRRSSVILINGLNVSMISLSRILERVNNVIAKGIAGCIYVYLPLEYFTISVPCPKTVLS